LAKFTIPPQEHLSRDKNSIKRLSKVANLRLHAIPEDLRHPAIQELRKEQLQPLLEGRQLLYQQKIIITALLAVAKP
jgi:hypothetical protein